MTNYRIFTASDCEIQQGIIEHFRKKDINNLRREYIESMIHNIQERMDEVLSFTEQDTLQDQIDKVIDHVLMHRERGRQMRYRH